MTGNACVSRWSIHRTGLAFVFLLLLAAPPEALGQRWLQTAQLEVEVEQREWSRTLLDTLRQVLSRTDSLKVKRSSSQEAGHRFGMVKERLLEGEELGPDEATHVRIDYKFRRNNQDFEESIESIQFLYRPDPEHDPVSLLLVDGDKPWVQALLHDKRARRSMPPNCGWYPSFSNVITFARVYEDAKILKIAEQDVRDGYEEEKRRLTEKIVRLTYKLW